MDARALFVLRMHEAAEAVRRELEAAGAGDLVRESITVIETGHGVKVSFFVEGAHRAKPREIAAPKPRKGKGSEDAE